MAGAQVQVPVATGSTRSRSATLPSFDAAELWFPARGRIDPHEHARTNLAVMLEGSFDVGLHNEVVGCPAGTVIVEPAGERHWNRMDRAGAHVLVLQIDPGAEILSGEVRAALERSTCFRDAAIPALARRLSLELQQPDAVSALAIEGLGLEMLAVAARQGGAGPARGAPPRWVERAREIIHDRCFESIRVGDVAGEVGVHPVHFARVFRKHFQSSVGSYVRTLRLNHAATRLSQSEASISEIAIECGFADQSHLTRLFRRHLGTTPDRYRRATRGD